MTKFKYGSQINPSIETDNSNCCYKKNDITIETFKLLNNEDPNIPENDWELKLS
jgi:hypothetical protein